MQSCKVVSEVALGDQSCRHACAKWSGHSRSAINHAKFKGMIISVALSDRLVLGSISEFNGSDKLINIARKRAYTHY